MYNILEEGTVTITNNDSGYPKERLYDRSLGFYCQYSSSGTFNVVVSGNSLDVDTLIVEGHDFDGVSLTWAYSDNGSDYTNVHSWSQSGNSQIVKTIPSALSHAWWRLQSTSSAFQATEIFMGRQLQLPVVWSNNPIFQSVQTVENVQTYGGVDHFNKIGEERRTRQYKVLMDRNSYPVATFNSDLAYLDGYKPLYLIDHEDDCFLCHWYGNLPKSGHMNEGLMLTDMVFTEVPS
jgi:hypothetical protein